jgi:uncharacterized membrane protein YedE/YeeE
MDWIFEPWPWYVGGPMIALVMLLLLLNGGKFGMSSNLRTLCTMCGAGKSTQFFDFDWKSQRWNLVVVLGAFVGGFVGANYLSTETAVALNPDVVRQLQDFGIQDAGAAYLPERFFENNVWTDWKSLSLLVAGGFMVGFGARYAGGCTSGHAISGLSNLQLPSLIAVIGFFIGGLLMNHLLLPYLL